MKFEKDQSVHATKLGAEKQKGTIVRMLEEHKPLPDDERSYVRKLIESHNLIFRWSSLKVITRK